MPQIFVNLAKNFARYRYSLLLLDDVAQSHAGVVAFGHHVNSSSVRLVSA
jgi:hypothetical protein